MVRVLFLTLYPDTAASPRRRVSQFLPYLREQGVECDVASALTPDEYARLTGPERRVRPFFYHAIETPRRLRQLFTARAYPIVFVQKAIMTAYIRGMAGLLRRLARRVVYDIDDAMFLTPPHALRWPWRLAEDRRQIEKVARAADLVLAGNAWLAKWARQLGAPTDLFPTVVDTGRFTPAAAPDRFTIGWIGGPSTAPALSIVREALERTQNAAVRIVGSSGADGLSERVVRVPWSLESEVESLRSFSVGIMPLEKTEWSRGKCALKALQYMACGIPCVSTPFGAILDIITDGENGLFADSTEEWIEAFERLRDPVERRRLGEAGRATVEARFSLKAAAPRLLDLLERLA